MTLKINTNDGYPPVFNHLRPADFIKGTSLGLDLEWGSDGRPSIIGLAQRQGNEWCAHGVEWNEENEAKLREVLGEASELVGHHITGADKPVLYKFLLFPTMPEKSFDTFIYFFLTNSHLCKARAEKPGELSYESSSETAKGGGGFMNIWTMSSLYTELRNWKYCRATYGKLHSSRGASDCIGPCPHHKPMDYCAIDALAPLMARDKLEREAKIKKVDHLVPILEQAVAIAARMQEEGILVDMTALEKLEKKIATQRADVILELPEEVNWNSWQQIKAFFKNKYGLEPKTTSEEDLREFYNQYEFEEAGKLVDLKEVGRGLKSWFDRRYIDSNNLLHPSFKPAGGTSTGRWASSDPNFQNIPTRTALGKEIRKLIIARPGYYLVKADYRQAEARVVLNLSGYKVPNDGSFKQWLINAYALDASDPGVKALGGVWNATKSVAHAGNYAEGLTLHTLEELKSNYCRNLVAKGALEVYEDWTYCGRIVCRTGVNLAARMFGRATFEYRKKALDITRRYFTKFPGVLDWQKRVSKQVEEDGFVRSAFGFRLETYGHPLPKLKTALAMLGSNPVAMFTNHAIIRAAQDYVTPRAQVHDELLWEYSDDMPIKKVIEDVRGYMEFEHDALPGLILPIEVGKGLSWGLMEHVYGD